MNHLSFHLLMQYIRLTSASLPGILSLASLGRGDGSVTE